MKKLITFLFCFGLFTAAFAQSKRDQRNGNQITQYNYQKSFEQHAYNTNQWNKDNDRDDIHYGYNQKVNDRDRDDHYNNRNAFYNNERRDNRKPSFKIVSERGRDRDRD
jgi:hypothetical protein